MLAKEDRVLSREIPVLDSEGPELVCEEHVLTRDSPLSS